MPNLKNYGNASQVTVHIDDYGGKGSAVGNYAGGGYVHGGKVAKYKHGGKVTKNMPKKPKAGNKSPMSY